MVCETDQYFHKPLENGGTKYDYDEARLPAARQWNFDRFAQAIQARISPIVVDRGNGLNEETQRYARYAVAAGYRVELREPESDWWREIKSLLNNKSTSSALLDQWADRLAAMNKTTHRTPRSTIRRWMAHWRHDLTVQEILDYTQSKRK